MLLRHKGLGTQSFDWGMARHGMNPDNESQEKDRLPGYPGSHPWPRIQHQGCRA
jgi:hypothetical protein